MEIDYIKEFTILAKTNSYSEAADLLFTSQSTLSKHIMSLEKELGVSLFNRTTKRVSLNEFGKIFLPYAKQMLNLNGNCMCELNNRKNNISSPLTLGSIPIMVQYKITEAIAGFQKMHPEFTLDIYEEDSSVLKEMLRERKCELAFIPDFEDVDNEFYKIPYAEDTLAAVLPKTHRLANNESIQLSMLCYEKFLLLPDYTTVNRIFMESCRQLGFKPDVKLTAHRGENLVDLVARNMGISMLLKRAALYVANPNTVIIDIKPNVTCEISLFYKKHSNLSAASLRFIDYLETTAKIV
jgi:LysR family transcriptional activator of glutamate synthase operon